MATCEECGFATDSQEHARGVGLHGHVRQSDREADRQRAEVFARARAFAEAQAEQEVKHASVPYTGEQLARMTKAELIALLTPQEE